MSQIKSVISSISRSQVKNNTQRVALRLLAADGQWVPRHKLTRVPSATARIRDLRKERYGSFQVECASSDELSRKTSKKTYYYRIVPSSVTAEQVRSLFAI